LSEGISHPADPTANPNNIMKTKLLALTAAATVLLTSHLSAAILPYDDFMDIDIIDLEIPASATPGFGGITGILDVGRDPSLPADTYTKYDKVGFVPNQYTVTNVALAFSFYQWVFDAQTQTQKRQWAQIDVDLGLGDAGGLMQTSNAGVGVSNPADEPVEFNLLLATSPLGLSGSLTEEVALKLIADIQEDGKISWGVEVGNVTGMHLYAAGLGVEAHRVPDSGSAMAFLGAGIFGLLIVRRRMR